MGYGGGSFQATRTQIDDVTVIQTPSTGKITSSQGNSSFIPIVPVPANNGLVWGFGEISVFQVTAATMVFNAQANWSLPSKYASIIDSFQCIYDMDYGYSTSNVAASSTSIKNIIAGASNNQMIIVFVTANANSGTNPPVITISDTLSLTWVQRAIQTQNNLAVYEFYAQTTSTAQTTITATADVNSNLFMESATLSAAAEISPLATATTYANPNPTVVGTTPLIDFTVSSSYVGLIVAYFGGPISATGFIANLGNASGIYGMPIALSGTTSGQVLSYDGSAWVNSDTSLVVANTSDVLIT